MMLDRARLSPLAFRLRCGRDMKLQALVFALALVLLMRPATAYADCTEDGSDCPGAALAVAGIVVVGSMEAGMLIGGLVTMAGGAHDIARQRYSGGWRVANYVFAGLNLAAGVAWAGLAVAGVERSIAIGFAVPNLAIGGADLAVGLVAASHSGDAVNLSFAPMAGRDATGHALSGVSLRLTF
jgi:anti-sigma factor RsiW